MSYNDSHLPNELQFQLRVRIEPSAAHHTARVQQQQAPTAAKAAAASRLSAASPDATGGEASEDEAHREAMTIHVRIVITVGSRLDPTAARR